MLIHKRADWCPVCQRLGVALGTEGIWLMQTWRAEHRDSPGYLQCYNAVDADPCEAQQFHGPSHTFCPCSMVRTPRSSTLLRHPLLSLSVPSAWYHLSRLSRPSLTLFFTHRRLKTPDPGQLPPKPVASVCRGGGSPGSFLHALRLFLSLQPPFLLLLLLPPSPLQWRCQALR